MTIQTITARRNFGDYEGDTVPVRRGPPVISGYIVISDALPVEKGGFSAGATIEKYGMDALLKDKNITLGTIVKRGNVTYRVSLLHTGSYCLSKAQG